MKFSGATVHYLLSRTYDDVSCDAAARKTMFDYPLLYDVTSDMSGHAVLVPDHERPDGGPLMQDVLCVCTSAGPAQAARKAGLAVVEVRTRVSFPRLYNDLQSIYMMGEALEARLRAYVDSFAGYQALVDACVQAVGFPCAIIDKQFRTLYRSPAAEADLLGPDAVDLFMASREYRPSRESRRVFMVPGSGELLMKNLFAGNELVGTVAMSFEADSLSARFARSVLNYFCPYVEEMYVRLGSFELPATGAGRVRLTLQEIAGGDDAAVARLDAALAEEGHSVNARYVVLRIERSFTHEGPDDIDYLARRFELAWPDAYSFTVGSDLHMLVDVGAPEADAQRAFFRNLPIVARENLSKVGVSRVFSSLDNLMASCMQATRALECGNELNSMHWCYRFEEYALPWLVSRAWGHDPAQLVMHPALPALQHYDAQHGSELVASLHAFMRNRYNATAAANELYVARSTLLNRLERIYELTGVDLEDPGERLHLALSFAMNDLR